MAPGKEKGDEAAVPHHLFGWTYTNLEETSPWKSCCSLLAIRRRCVSRVLLVQPASNEHTNYLCTHLQGQTLFNRHYRFHVSWFISLKAIH